MSIMSILVASGAKGRATPTQVFSTNTTNTSINITTLSGYIAGKSDVTITINSGVYLYSTTTASPALSLTGGVSGDTVTIVNNGYILGQGGQGGGWNSSVASPSTAGGPALSIGFATAVVNTAGYICGGGGGGAAGAQAGLGSGGGGGAGGGGGGPMSTYGSAAGGGPGLIGATGGSASTGNRGGGGGGRIVPGTGGAGGGTSGGAGGSANNVGGNAVANPSQTNAPGIGGGSGGGGGASYSKYVRSGGGGGGWGASGGLGLVSTTVQTGASAGGKAVNLNGNAITWFAGNTSRVFGAVS